MNDKKDKKGVLLSDTERLTSIGKLVRKTSIDELPNSISKIYDDNVPFKLLGYDVTGFDSDFTGDYIISIGNNKARKKIAKQLVNGV